MWKTHKSTKAHWSSAPPAVMSQQYSPLISPGERGQSGFAAVHVCAHQVYIVMGSMESLHVYKVHNQTVPLNIQHCDTMK